MRETDDLRVVTDIVLYAQTRSGRRTNGRWHIVDPGTDDHAIESLCGRNLCSPALPLDEVPAYSLRCITCQSRLMTDEEN